MGPCIVGIFQYISTKMQRYTVYLFLETALHVSGGTTTHHQEHTQLYLQHLALVKVPDTADTVVCAPDDGWRYLPKHVEQFPDINKPCNVASCWIYTRILILLLLLLLTKPIIMFLASILFLFCLSAKLLCLLLIFTTLSAYPTILDWTTLNT